MNDNKTKIELCDDILKQCQELQVMIQDLTEELIKQDLQTCLSQIGFPVGEVTVREIINNGIYKGDLQ